MDKSRYLHNIIEKKLTAKMVFLCGPRQCGKTTLSKSIFLNLPPESRVYINWDSNADRQSILKDQLVTDAQLIIFDEIHKYTRWRNYIKGWSKRGQTP